MAPEVGSGPLPHCTLVLGGARSGKSRFAEETLKASGLAPVVIATAQAWDDEMRARIAQHRRRRAPEWRTIEEPLALAPTLEETCTPERAVLVDCLTLWLTNLMLAKRDVAGECERLLAVLPGLRGPLVLVSNEVGQGVVPANAMARAFIDHAGRLHQALAAQAGRVVFMLAGLPQALKG